MGNCQPVNMFTSRNKEFQSVMPFPNDGTEVSQSGKKRKLSPQKTNKTAPSPQSDEVTVRKLPASADPATATESGKHQKFGDAGKGNDETFTAKSGDGSTVGGSADGGYLQTESQQRRERMADCEFECSRITSYLFVGGYHIATNREILRQNGITHVINCSAAVVENAFIHDTSLKYLSLSMVDGRQDDISWFLCEVVQFIMKARAVGGKVLIHCEKGISRSCSYAIAYRMWATGDKWKACFDYVKKGRSVCSPNTAFTCNLIELGELLGKDAARTGAGGNLLFRCAYHLPHDPKTAVLKMCRTADSRKIMVPATSLLDPKGVFVIRTVSSNDASVQKSADQHRLFLWQGAEATDGTAKRAEGLAKKMHGVLTTTDKVEWVKQGEESFEFLSYLIDDGAFSSTDNSLFDDLYDYPPSEEQTLQSMRQMEADHTRNNSDPFKVPTPARESSIKGFAEFSPGPLSRESSMRSQPVYQSQLSRESSVRSQPVYQLSRESSMPVPMYQLSRESSTRRGSGVGTVDLQALMARRASGNTFVMTDATSKETITTVSTSTAGPRSASRTRIDSSESPSASANNSRRNSDAVTPFTRIPSIQLSSIEENRTSAENTPPAGVLPMGSPIETSANARRKLIPELSLAPKGTLLQMQRVSEGDINSSDPSSSRLNSSRDHSARDPGSSEVRGASAVTPLSLQKQLSGGSAKITLPTLSLQKALSPKPADLALNLSTPTKSSPNMSAMGSKVGSKVTLALGTLSPEADSEPPMLQRQGSEEKIKPRLTPAIMPSTSADGSPRSGSRPTSAVGSGHSPMTERRLSGGAASLMALGRGTSSNSNSAANLHGVLPLKVLERSPSNERHPQDVGLPRGPTPIEDLISPRDHTYSHATNLLLPVHADPAYLQRSTSQHSVAALVKPMLFQAVPREMPDVPRPGKRAPSGSPVVRYEWQGMGVYDDEDLDEVRCRVLCYFAAHFRCTYNYFGVPSSTVIMGAGLAVHSAVPEQRAQDLGGLGLPRARGGHRDGRGRGRAQRGECAPLGGEGAARRGALREHCGQPPADQRGRNRRDVSSVVHCFAPVCGGVI
jgi:hypothetical protein